MFLLFESPFHGISKEIGFFLTTYNFYTYTTLLGGDFILLSSALIKSALFSDPNNILGFSSF